MENDELLIPLEIDEEKPDYSIFSKESIINTYGYLPYNLFLFEERDKRGLSRYQFCKLLEISFFRYSFIEKGYFKPTKKEIEKISLALNLDFSIYLEGLASYPIGLTYQEEPSRVRKYIKSKPFRLTLLCLLFSFIFLYIFSRAYSSNINTFTKNKLCDTYIALMDGISQSEEFTYTISGSFTRPMIYERIGEEYISIIGEYELHPFQMDLNYTIFMEEYRITYSTSIARMRKDSFPISVTYVDYINYDEAKASYLYKRDEGYTLLSLYDASTTIEIEDSTIKNRINYYVVSFNERIEDLIYRSLGLEISIDQDILANTIPTMDLMNRYGYISLLIYLFSLVFIVVCAILLSYSFISGKEKHSKYLLSDSEYEDQVLDIYIESRRVPKDIRFGPFLPETLFQIIGGIFTVGSILASLAFFIMNLIGKGDMFSNVGLNSGLTILVSGIFLMLFVDFDIYLNDRRVLRNVLIYFIIFFFIYNIQVLVINYLSQISLGLMAIEKFNLKLPNYFSSIALYFMIMLFLFTNPKWANTKKRIIIYRLFALIPIFLLLLTTTISIGHKSFGWVLPNSLLYLVDAAKPQISFLVVSYLVGLFLIRVFFKRKYDTKNALRFFNGNRYLWCKNLLALGITILITIIELIFMNNPSAKALGFGLYPTFFWIGLILLFHRPHLGRRKRAAERATLVLNTILFASLYIAVAIALILTLLIVLV